MPRALLLLAVPAVAAALVFGLRERSPSDSGPVRAGGAETDAADLEGVTPLVEAAAGTRDRAPAVPEDATPATPSSPAPRATGDARLVGRVTNLAGEPLPGARLQFCKHHSTTLSFADAGEPTGADGRYEADHDSNQFFVLRAWAEGYGVVLAGPFWAQKEPLVTDFVLGRGPALEGTVEGPAGVPLAGARVVVWAKLGRPDVAKEGFSLRYRGALQPIGFAHADADGRFRVQGLMDRTWRVEASVERDDANLVALVHDVHPRAGELEIVLGPPLVLDVELVDDTGAPVDAKSVRAWPAPGGEVSYAEPVERKGTAGAQPGAYRVADLCPGAWRVKPSAKGLHVRPDRRARDFTLPRSGPARIVMDRGATLTGRVVDGTGRPVPGAQVGLAHFGKMHAVCDSDGEFRLDAVRPGAVTLVAGHGEPKVEHPLVVAAGATYGGIELQLAATATLEVTVLDLDGAPVDEAEVRIVRGPKLGQEGSTDSQGLARFGGLEPGRWFVFAVPQYDGSWEETFKRLVRAEVDVTSGENVQVVLRGELPDPVQVEGRITLGGVPAAGRACLVPEGGAFFEAGDGERLDREGCLQVEVPRPGLYAFVLQRKGDDALPPIPVRVLPGPVYSFAIELSLGSIEGVVRDATGTPVAAELALTRVDMPTQMIVPGRSRPRPARAGADGRFRFDDVDAGLWQVTAGTPDGGGASPLLAVRGDAPVETEVVLAPVGPLAGTVRRAGGAVSRPALVYAWDVDGAPLSRWPIEVEDDGTFGMDAFPRAGGHLLAVAPGLAGTADVAAGHEGLVPIELRPAGVLDARAEDAAGEPVAARFALLDAAGRDHAHVLDPAELERGPWRTFSQATLRVGTAPPGRYTVTARAHDGREVSRIAIVRAAQRALVRLEY